MFFAIFAWDKPESSALRATTKLRHKAYLDAGAPGVKVLQSGPLLSDAEQEIGSLIIVEAETASAAEAFLSGDPYLEVDLFAERRMHPWLWRRGNPYLLS